MIHKIYFIWLLFVLEVCLGSIGFINITKETNITFNTANPNISYLLSIEKRNASFLNPGHRENILPQTTPLSDTYTLVALIETINNNPRVLFLVSIFAGGIFLMCIVMTVGILYFCSRIMYTQKSALYNDKAAGAAKMAAISREHHHKFQPVLQELRSLSFKRKQSKHTNASIEQKIKKSKIQMDKDKEEEEEKALMPMDTTTFIGEKSIIEIKSESKENDNCTDEQNDSFKDHLHDNVKCIELLLDGIVESIETRNRALL
eukprot:51233_1